MATSKVTPFVSPTQVSPQQISQVELTLILSLRGRAKQLSDQIEAAEKSLTARLQSGAAIEPGDHSAEVKECLRRNVSWKDVASRLARRLGYDADVYCSRVLVATKPNRSLSLVVN